MTDSCWFPQVISGTGMQQVWNGHGTDTQHNAIVGLDWRVLEWNSRTCSVSLDRCLDQDVRFPLFWTNHTDR